MLGDSLGAFFCAQALEKTCCHAEQSFAKVLEGIIVMAMKLALMFSVCSAAALTFTSCGGGGGSGSPSAGGITGPFDRNGNYVEEWADNPSKWRKNGGSSIARSEGLPQVAANDQPPANSNPLTASGTPVITRPIAPTIAQTRVVTRPQTIITQPVVIDRSAEIAAANRRREIARDRARENARDEARAKARAEAREEARLDARREARAAGLKKKGGRAKAEARPAKGKVTAKKPVVKAKAKPAVKAKAKKVAVPEKKKKKK